MPQHLLGTLTGAISLSKTNKVCLCASVQVKQQLGRLVQGPEQTKGVSPAAGGIVHMSLHYCTYVCLCSSIMISQRGQQDLATRPVCETHCTFVSACVQWQGPLRLEHGTGQVSSLKLLDSMQLGAAVDVLVLQEQARLSGLRWMALFV